MPKKGGNKNKNNKKKSPNKNSQSQDKNKAQDTSDKSQLNENDNNNNNNTKLESTSSQPNNDNNSNITNLADNQASQLKEQGNQEFQKGNIVRAIELYTKALELLPNEHTIYSNRAAAYSQNKQYDLALKDADKCIELQPAWPKGYLRKGLTLAELRNFDQADKIIREGLSKCNEKSALNQALNDLDTKKISLLSKDEKIFGGDHLQTDKFRRMINWLLQGGAKFPKLYLKFYSPEYRAIHAMERIAKDEDICYIPHDYIMTSDIAKASKLGKAIVDSKLELRSKHSYLAAYLLQEKELGEKSKWFPYIDILPRKFETIPLFFNADQRKELEGSIALKKIDDRIESLQLEYDAICKEVPEFKRFPHLDFVWARLVVITRIFGLVIDNVKTDGLVPMADMLNHKRPRETKWTYEDQQKGFVITSLQPLKKDAELFDSYGRKCNSRFFVNYGFSLENNEDNEACFLFEIPQNDPQLPLKGRYLGLNPHELLSKREYQIPRQYKEKKVKECFTFLRILHAQSSELLVISSIDNGQRMEDIPPLSIKNESSVLTSLAVAAKRQLNLFPNTIDDDIKLLNDEEKCPKFSNFRNTVLMRHGEKEVLHFYLDLVKVCLPLFRTKINDLKTKLRREYKNPEDPLTQYIQYVVVPLVHRESRLNK